MSYVYILRCADGTLYSGWTSDVTRRLAAHNGGTAGAKYTRARRPVTLVHCEKCADQSEAMRREAALKKLTRAEKEALVARTARTHDEFLTVLDATNEPCGTLPRSLVHECGLRHRVVHVLVFETRQQTCGIWLQQRGFDRPTLPGYYDWTSTGHLDPGETPEIGACREAREEIGLEIAPEELVPAGEFHFQVQRSPSHFDDEIASAFLYFAPQTPAFAPGDEVARVVWTPCRAIAASFREGVELPITPFGGEESTAPGGRLSPSPREWNAIHKLLKQREQMRKQTV